MSVNFSLLQGFASLDHCVKIFVPSTVNVNEAASAAKVAKNVESISIAMSRMFGGCTSTNGRGSWVDASDCLISEDVVICSSNCDLEALNNKLVEVIDLAKWLCENMSQDCISVEVDGRLFFIS